MLQHVQPDNPMITDLPLGLNHLRRLRKEEGGQMIEMVCDDAEEGEIQADEVSAILPTRKPKKEKIRAQNCSTSTQDPSASSPGSHLDVYAGKCASVEIKADFPIRLVDVQGLVLWTLAEAVSPRWVFLKVRVCDHFMHALMQKQLMSASHSYDLRTCWIMHGRISH